MNDKFEDICKRYNIFEWKELNKGFSNDRKYVLKSNNKESYILRLSNIKHFELRQQQFELLKLLDCTIECSKVLELGLFNQEYCFLITTFVKGVDAKDVVKDFNDKDSYSLGIKTGKILRKWHNTVVDSSNVSWYNKCKRKKDNIVKDLLKCEYSIPLQDKLLRYYDEKLYLMKDRPVVFCHGDFHLGNMIFKNDEIGIIDVVNCSLADPYEEFKRSYWSIVENEYFQTGIVNGYFDDNIPNDFFEILKFYSIESMITRLLRATNNEKRKSIYVLNECQVKWWRGFDADLPTWYKGVL